ncbi:MAG: hypothetical protein K6L75_05070 [Cellvibrionaceae bacterium]
MFSREDEFEAYLRDLIQSRICSTNPDLQLLDSKKSVDILICRNGANPKAFFIEVKFHKKSHGRLGFGSGGGKGIQPEVVSKQPDYFEAYLRWIIADETTNNSNMIFIPTSTLVNYLSGKTVGEKHNNIQKKIFKEVDGFDENGLVEQLTNWLKS